MKESGISSPGFRALLLAFSVTVHAALLTAIAATAGVESGPAAVIDLGARKKVPFALSVSLTGRRGNTYDRSKISAALKAEEIKKKLSKKYLEVYENLKNIQKNAYTTARETEELKKLAAAARDALDKMKKALSEKARESSEVAVVRAAVKKKRKKPAAERPPEIAPEEPDGNAGENGVPEGETAESFGNMSGNLAAGERLAGAPHGEADPAIEAGEIDIFKSAVAEKIRRNLKYPERCRRRGAEGAVRVAFEIGPDGKVNSVSVEKSSGDSDLDEAAAAAVSEGSPYIPIPAALKGRTVSFKLPLNFKLK